MKRIHIKNTIFEFDFWKPEKNRITFKTPSIQFGYFYGSYMIAIDIFFWTFIFRIRKYVQ